MPHSDFIFGDYSDAWKKVDSLEQKGLYKSALAEVESIYQLAKKEKNGPQSIKAIIFKGKYTTMLEEDGFPLAIQQFEENLKQAEQPEKAVLHSMLGELYSTYLDNRYYQIQDRTALENPEDGDILTWTVDQISRVARDHFMASVQNPDQLKSYRSEYLKDICYPGQNDSIVGPLRPSLLDFLSQRAILNLSNERNYLTEPAYKFYLDAQEAFADAETFSKYNFETRDSSSGKWLSTRLFQQLTTAHLSETEPTPLIGIEMGRLLFAWNNSVHPESNKLYVEALRKLANRAPKHPATAEVNYQLAQAYLQNASLEDANKAEAAIEAAKLCKKTIEQFPDSYGTKQCASLLQSLETPDLNLIPEQTYLPQKSILFKVRYKNLSKVFVRVYKGSHEVDRWDRMGYDDKLKAVLKQPMVQSKQFELPQVPDYQNHEIELGLDGLPPGNYFITYASDESFEYGTCFVGFASVDVSGLTGVQYQEDGQFSMYTLDRDTGTPRAGVKVDYYSSKWTRAQRKQVYKLEASGLSNVNGLVTNDLPKNEGYAIRLSQGSDTLWLNGRYSNYRTTPGRESHRMQFFTDRSIYRPGQTVYFKGLMLGFDKDRIPEIIKNELVRVVFYDANGQKVESLDLRTNDYGTINGAFTAPSNGLTGGMWIQVEGISGRANFNVEEYKRPKFEVSFNPVEGAYRVNDKVKLSGTAKNYAGNAVDGATVRYRVVRNARFPFWYGWYMRRPNSPTTEILNGEGQTNAEGVFEIEFEALPDRSVAEKDLPVFDYTVYVDVTDVTGETRSGETGVSAGYIALQLSLNLEQAMHKDSLSKTAINATNLSGQAISAQGSITLTQLVAPKNRFVKRYWDPGDQDYYSEAEFKKLFPDYAWKGEDQPMNWDRTDFSITQTFNTAESKTINLGNKRLTPGYYLLHLESKDAFGKTVQSDQILQVWDEAHRALAMSGVEVFSEKMQYEPGETARVFLGTSLGNVQFFVAVEKDKKLQTNQWIKANPVGQIEIPVEENDRGGIIVHAFAFAKNRELFLESVRINVPWSNKDLQVEMESFRDKLAPGQQEEWRIKIKGPKKELVAAEMLAGMYDASLDQFLPHSWSKVSFPPYYAQVTWRPDGTYRQGYTQSYQPTNKDYISVPGRVFQRLNWFGFPMYGMRAYAAGMAKSRRAKAENEPMIEQDAVMMGAPPMEADEVLNEVVLTSSPANKTTILFDTADAVNNQKEPGAQNAPPSPIRTNLKETVFFFPDLKTDADGNVIVKFTMNEALTRWKFMAFAHTQSLQNNLITKEVVTQKDLMILANPPRFLRAGDRILFPAKISNLTEEKIAGTASLSLLDAATRKPVEAEFGMNTASRQKTFEVEAGRSSAVLWEIIIPEDYSGAITWQVFADSKTARDGEESTLPVVTNRMLVTESTAISVRGNQTKEIDFAIPQSSTSTPYKYTLEFSSNPAWYAVQALPYLMEFPHECSEQIFSRLYANTLASSVTRKMPAIKNVYDRWKGTDALESNLSKNQELKYALLEETPWVFEAQEEAQQKRQIALLFDLNRMAQERDKAIHELQQRQSSSGGWPWFPGGRDSWTITQHILSGFGHLEKLGALTQQDAPQTEDMLRRALQFCEEEAEQQYEDLKKEAKKGRIKLEDDHLNATTIQFLYARSFYKTDKSDEFVTYYLGQAEKYWLGKGLYQEGMLALILHRYGNTSAAQDIVNSLRERAQDKEELGMYWSFNWGFYWYQLPIETQALMVEVFDEVANDKEAVDKLRIWLLKNKQTNRWESTKATAEAVYALLLHGDNWLNNTKPVQVSLGNKVVKSQPKLNPAPVILNKVGNRIKFQNPGPKSR
ncbi:MAG: alpha-2-macroglobulin family protein [Saprospiraceae bacterium]